MSLRDKVSFNAMIFGFSSCGDMGMAEMIFDAMPERDVISWNSMISGFLQNGDLEESLRIFVRMLRECVCYDRTTFSVVLKACAGLEYGTLGMQVHAMAVKTGLDLDVVSASAIVFMYGKCRRLDDSFSFFGEMVEKNWVSWSALIASCVQNGELVTGLELFKEMQLEGVGVSQSTYASVFRSCAALCESIFGAQLHCHALKTNFGYDVIVGTAILDMYAKCGNLSDAAKMFKMFPKRNLQSHNALIVGYARADCGFDALKIFWRLLNSNLGFNEISLSGAFSACAVIKDHLHGSQIHGLAIKTPYACDVCVANAILDMYGKCGVLEEARAVFDAMKIRDAVSWNAIIAAYEQNGVEEETLFLYTRMLQLRLEPDEFTYGSVLKSCAGQQALETGVCIHNRIIKSGMGLETFVGTALMDMYCKCDKMNEAEKLHERMMVGTMVSWNAIISGFSSNEQSEEAQKFFLKMLEKGVTPDNFTYATVLDTCANLATVELGKQVHAQIIKQDLQSDVYITSTLVDMYSKCGLLQDSRLLFERSRNRDFVTWNAMVCGYAQHGLGEDALKVFEKMKLENVKPNHATFVAVLRACAHMGLVREGMCYFKSMQLDYGLDPKVEHYSCMVDLLGRCDRVSDALKVIQGMPFEADDVIWRTLLSICKMQGNVEVAEIAATRLLQLDPQDSSSYILLSNIYANAGMWDKVSNLRKILRHCRIKKEPGCSWIELLSEVHMFLVSDKAHPNCEDIYDNLDLLTGDMRRRGYTSDTESLLDEVMEHNIC
ncbi:hypothetical protein Leryth_021965 [Lithospermum erythrorhizon]|nr:hypothetical protein Leryth_021965 [Lithospermum erythrorhizon]